jgi:hypothetical protein
MRTETYPFEVLKALSDMFRVEKILLFCSED